MTLQFAPKKPVVLINMTSSTTVDISAQLTSILERYGYAKPEIFVGPSSDMGDMMDRMRSAGGDMLISYGGDGTAAAVASIARDQNVPFIALPGGTMNVLMLGLYGSDQWTDCLMRGLACAHPRAMTAGVVVDDRGTRETFMVGAMFGTPTKMNQAREELRDGNIVEAAKGAMDAMKATSIATPILFRQAEASAADIPFELLTVTCPFMNSAALDPDQLDVILFEQVIGGSAVSLGLAALRGNIRQSDVANHIKITRLSLHADHPIEALLDGEPHTFHGPVSVEIDRAHGFVLAPWPAMSFPVQSSA